LIFSALLRAFPCEIKDLAPPRDGHVICNVKGPLTRGNTFDTSLIQGDKMDLIRSTHRSNAAGIARSWQASSGKLKRFLARYEHNEADVEDIVQDALLEAVRCVDRFEGKSSMETWIFGIAINVARHHVAAATQRSRVMTSADALTEHSPDALDALCGTSQCDEPSNRTQSLQFVERLAKVVKAMPEELQRTFELLCVQECSYLEAADAMGIPVGTVRSRLHRLRGLLRSSMM
jgi:RNA polymerase sigma factor (sigma-70 family)